MVKRPRKRDRYDTTGNPEAEHVDAEKTILKNRKGITTLAELERVEEEGLVLAYQSLFQEATTETSMTCELLRHIHARIFGELYEWAGRWRTVWISKPGITWPAPDFLQQNMETYEREVLGRYPPAILKSDDDFCNAAAVIQGEFLVIHPFREGNARTIKLLTDLLAAQTDRPLLKYEQSEEGQSRYVQAAGAAFRREYHPMAELIRGALERGYSRR